MFPIAMSALPANVDATLTVSSGNDVPTATMVIPMIYSLIFSLCAIAAEPFVSQVAPDVIITKPMMSKIHVKIMLKSNYFVKTATKIVKK